MTTPSWGTVAMGAAIGFLSGAITAAVMMQWPGQLLDQSRDEARDAVRVRGAPATEAGIVRAEPPPAAAAPRIGLSPLADLRSRNLEVPVEGVDRSALIESFNAARDGRRHEAVDILAPRHTLVVAAEDGSIARLFESRAGGTTIYQFDPTATYVYYYAHLERYADGLREGMPVTRGQVIGYVGTTGNAPEDTPHLHFAIFKLTQSKRWWEGTAIDPFHVLR
jgi:murein DD-endopeptidase MepM/ murein hydrolase activator NlpD